jgi:hypothetical protein
VAAPTTSVATAVVAQPESGPVRRSTLDDDGQPRARWERWVGWGVVAVCIWLVWCALDAHHDWGVDIQFGHGLFGWIPTGVHFNQFKFGDLFLNTTTNGGDMGAHVWWPKFLIQNWFPKGRISGWAPDWYDGFPVGQYYFPLPALAIWFLQVFMPYNVAFKLVTVSGPLLLPPAAYYFAKKMRAPWPAPPAFAIAALGMLMETRQDWQIYGGNLASTLAGEFSFCIGLALALFGLGALAYTLDTGKKRWLPALLIAMAIMSHIVVAIFIAIAATLLWLTRRPKRTFPLAVAIGGVAIAIPAVWLLPLLTDQQYTQSMRYTKSVPQGSFTMWTWLDAPKWLPLHNFIKDHLTGPVHDTINGFVRALGTYTDPSTHKSTMQPLWLPWWIWLLAGIAIVAAGWYRRRSTLVLLVLALALGIMFVQWPEHAIWNTRFLPFWLLTWGFLAAMGAAELVRFLALSMRWAYCWVKDGDVQDARARGWAELATDDNADEQTRKDAAWALAERRFAANPPGWEPPANLTREAIRERGTKVGVIALTVIVGLTGLYALNRGWEARNGGSKKNPPIVPVGWAQWNYEGYEKKSTYPQYHAIMTGMNDVADTYGNGRALWEPSSGDPDAINSYGTSLALELLPYFTHGKIGSMEGIYFESSATTSYHFLTVAECAEHPSNPVRGLLYGSPDGSNEHPNDNFSMCVKHLQMLGVRYLMLWTTQANAKAAQQPALTKIKEISAPVPGTDLKTWTVYQVANSDLVEGMSVEPVVATNMHAGKYSKCWGVAYDDTSSSEPELGPWECAAAPWWVNPNELNAPFTDKGPKDWQHVDANDLAKVTPTPVQPTSVSNVKRSVSSISFDVSEIGRPVLVKESYFPNWQASGAKGPYRIAPNLMVVIPTKQHVTLTYGLTKMDWLGRFITLLGLVGLVLLGLWKGGRRFRSDKDDDDEDAIDERDGATASDDHDENGNGDSHHDDDDSGGGEPPPDPDRREPAPALP